MTLSETAQAFGVPMTCAVIAVGTFAGWVVPWDARLTLRSSVKNIWLDVEADEVRGCLPLHSPRVERLRDILQAVSTDARRWPQAINYHSLDLLPGLRGVEQAMLNRHAQHLETALETYARRTWFSGDRVHVHVVDVIAAPAPDEHSTRAPHHIIDLNRPPHPYSPQGHLPGPRVSHDVTNAQPGSSSSRGRVLTVVGAAGAHVWASISGSGDYTRPVFVHDPRR